MRRVIFLFALVLGVVSCRNKIEIKEIKPETATVCIGYKMVSEIPMTKAVNQEQINQWIIDNLPTNVTFKLTDAQGNRTNVTCGTPTEIPLGTYTVTARYTPVSDGSVVGSDVFFSKTEPIIIVNTSLEVTYDKANYVVPATFGSFGIVYDLNEVASATYVSSHGESGSMPTTSVGQTAFVFVNGLLDTQYLEVTLNPRSGYKLAKHTFKSAYDPDCVTASFGNYYIIHPYEITSVEGGSLTYSTNGFVGVEVE